MAIAENGPNGYHRGRIGNILYYVLNGKNVSRKIGISTKPFTEAQHKHNMVTKIRSKFFRDVLDFINTGFSAEAIEYSDNGFNWAVKNNQNIITGTYPDLNIAYNQVMLSKGKLKPVQNCKATATTDGIEYTWDTDPEMAWPDATDQVMTLAYFPEQQRVFYTLFGNSRLSGSDLLEIPPSMRGKYMETYLSLISADRKQLSDSIYTGSFNSVNT